MQDKISYKCPESFFFCGSSWDCIFHLGVYKKMIELWGYKQLSNCKYSGNSSGALIACALAIGVPVNDLESIL